ncbi:50S ribosomal protein L25 [Blattabacterium cuenoti]|uniref:50S ribosomal protein L25 n=1 Tax=Blattabacterium cuenoti TaxID=1653831 RepID=UPI00163CEA6D|nr:50S ribosomal protein L25 [Blattabacterium cuenoti]
MKYITIYGEKRNIVKKCIRSNNKIPCILYGKNINIPFFSSLEEIKKIVFNKKICGVIIKLKINDNQYNNIKAIHKEIQFDPVKDNILHVDFYKIEESTPIILHIPIIFIGRPIGVSKGGECFIPIKKLKIKVFPINIPEYIKIDINHLDIGNKIIIKDLKKENYTILHSYNTLLVKIKKSRKSNISQNEDNNVKEKDDKKIDKKIINKKN